MTSPEDPGGVDPDVGAALDAMGQFGTVADTLAGFRAQLMAQGFTGEQAGDLVVESMRSANLNTEERLLTERRSGPWPWRR